MEKPSLDSEVSQTLLEGLLSALSAAAALQYTEDVYLFLDQIQKEIRSAQTENIGIVGQLNNETKLNSAPAMLESNYALLMMIIGHIGECIGPAFRSRNAAERLKRLITRARKHLLIIRDLLNVDGEPERN